MDVHVIDDQIGRYFRRHQLGLRFLAHGARAQTTCQWSGLTPDQLVTLRRRWMFNSDERLRGPSPSSFQVFFRSARSRNEATLFVSLCRIVGAIPPLRGAAAAKALASLENGERLCEAYETFREWMPDSNLEFEQAVLLATGSTDGEKLELTHCSRCHSALLVDKLDGVRDRCSHCRDKPAPQARAAGAKRTRLT